jgi:hypothetical protein
MNNKNQYPEHIMIIGIGSLGGFVAKSMSERNYIKTITLVDDDTVDERNLSNSIYTKEDIGKNKTFSLSNKLFSSGKKIETKTMQYNGENISYKDADLIIDCRDILCSVDDNISFKASISGELLIIDCNKNLSYNNETIEDGSYSTKLDAEMMQLAALKISRLISSLKIYTLIENNMTHTIDLFSVEKECNFAVSDVKENRMDNVIVDDSQVVKKVTNLFDVSNKLIKLNKTAPIKFKNNRLLFEENIPQNSLNNIKDIVEVIDPVINVPIPGHSYFLKINKVNCNIIVNIIQRDGGA